MRSSLPSLLAIGLAALGVVVLAACGSEDAKLLPGETAREITANLDTVQQLSNEGDCLGAESAAQQVGEQIEALRGVDQKLKQALEAGASRLEEVIDECDEEAEFVTPTTTEDEAPSVAGEKEAEKREREAEKAEKEAEKQAKEQGEEEESKQEGSPFLPPQANGEGKGIENGHGPPPEAEEGTEEAAGESASGGVSPSSPVEGE
jgi:hypothetical protein